MIKISRILVIFALLSSLSSFGLALSKANKKIIQNNLSELVKAWNDRRMNDFTQFYTENAVFINIFGEKFVGKKEIAERHVKLHDDKNIFLEFSEVDIKLFCPGMAKAVIIWRLRDTQTGPIIKEGIWSQIFIQNTDTWLIGFAQNTQISSKL